MGIPITLLLAGGIVAGTIAWREAERARATAHVLRIFGLRLDLRGSIDRFFAPVITDSDDCHCTSGLLPASLAGIKDVRQAASFILRDAERKVVYSSEPQYNGEGVVQEIAPELPFAGWSIEVAINPAVVRPLLPYGGQGTPWFALALVAGLILGSGALAFAALRGESQLFRLRQDFISNVSHELRTPLTRVRLFNELLVAGGQSDSEKSRHYRKVIDRECRRLTILIDNILDSSRLERGARKYGKTALDLRATLEDALESFRTASDEGRFRLESFLEPVGLVMGDSQALQQILINLLDNAVKYSPEGSLIEVRLTSEDNTARLSVTDHGCGIPKQEQERIFEPFYRIGASAGKANGATGSGLGLALVLGAVQAHGGQVTLKSEPGTGSTFTITIPLQKGEDLTA